MLTENVDNVDNSVERFYYGNQESTKNVVKCVKSGL